MSLIPFAPFARAEHLTLANSKTAWEANAFQLGRTKTAVVSAVLSGGTRIHFILRWDSARYSQPWHWLPRGKQQFHPCIVASFVPHSRDYGGPRAAYDTKGEWRSDQLSATHRLPNNNLLPSTKLSSECVGSLCSPCRCGETRLGPNHSMPARISPARQAA
jgi:hypothetical protein